MRVSGTHDAKYSAGHLPTSPSPTSNIRTPSPNPSTNVHGQRIHIHPQPSWGVPAGRSTPPLTFDSAKIVPACRTDLSVGCLGVSTRTGRLNLDGCQIRSSRPLRICL